ncbi:MAG TPA: methyltransferase domain-containing protein [Anaerolineae bacterium]|nr:methyltransferase domain-containing protein [Anaerolineae bacterium]
MPSELLYEIFEQRRSVRSYLRRKPDRSVIERIVYAATLAPSACNLQLHEFIYIDDDSVLEKLAKIATEKVRWAPACFVVVYDKRFTRFRHANLQSVAASVQNLLLAAESHGLATCWMAGFHNDDEIKQLLEIPKYLEIACLVSIGYSDENRIPPRPCKSGVPELLHTNVFNEKRPHIPETPNVDNWQLDQVTEYRRRIAPVYGDRFHLAPFPHDTAFTALRLLLRHVSRLQSGSELELLDAVTYDGVFAKLVYEQLCPPVHLTVSDYFRYPIENLIRAGICVEGIAIIDDNHEMLELPDSTFDVITCVNKIEFIPNPENLFRSWHRIAKPNAYLFLTTTSFWSPFAFWALYKVFRGTGNVYENNPFYRIGPFRFRPPWQVMYWLKKSGWTVRKAGIQLTRRIEGLDDLRHRERPAKDRGEWIKGRWFDWWLAHCPK